MVQRTQADQVEMSGDGSEAPDGVVTLAAVTKGDAVRLSTSMKYFTTFVLCYAQFAYVSA